MNPNLYRLHEIHEIERGLNEEKLKHSAMIKKYHCLQNCFTGWFFIFQFCMFLLNIGFLSDFEEIIGTISGKDLHGMNMFFVNASIFLKVIEKFLFKQIQRHEKQKTLIECSSTQFVTWFQRRCWTMKFPHQSLKKLLLK